MRDTVEVSLATSALEMFGKVGILAERETVPKHLRLFAQQADRVLENVRGLVRCHEMHVEQAHDFQQLIVAGFGVRNALLRSRLAF